MCETLSLNHAGFSGLNNDELFAIDGGVLFTFMGIGVTVMMCIKAGGAIGLAGGGVAAAVIFG